MKIPFVKMHGLGNDFIVIDCLERDDLAALDYTEIGKKLCDRRFGIGADQILLILPSSAADFCMKIYNADGSEVEMCGNGIRCFAKYLWDRKLTEKDVLAVETGAGIIRPERAGALVRVDMGTPVVDARSIPVNLDGTVKDYPLQILDKTFTITCVSMGNPHAVIFVDDVEKAGVATYGPVIETHGLFPRRINVEFIQVIAHDRLKMRVWERGSGETMACGTGASAAAVAGAITGRSGRQVTVELLGGELMIDWNEDGHVFMTGPAEEVFEGSITL